MGSVSLAYPTGIDFRSNRTPYRHFTAFVIAWLLAVNTSVAQMPLSLTKRYSQQNLPFASCYVSEFPLSSKKWYRGKKSNEQKSRCSRRPTSSSRQSAANQHRVFDVISKCIVGKRPDDPDLKPNTNDSRTNLTSRACEARAGLIRRLAIRD